LRYYLAMNVFRIIRVSLLTLLLSAGIARAESLVVLVDTGTEMPLADIRDGRLLGGIHKDVAEALAQKMGRRLETLVLPRKRIGPALESGRADMICLYIPEWLPGPFLWTQPFVSHPEVVLTTLARSAPHSIADLAGRPVGTVHGFEYPDLREVLGAGFVREDGPSDLANLRKMAAGRMQHVITNRIFYDYQLKQGEMIRAHPPLLVKQYMVRCALSPKGRVSLAEADAAISQLLREGAVHKILANYQ
jgi:ABC-type amino acid transport substrate-binding protein